MENIITCDKEDNCPFLHLATHLNHQMIVHAAITSKINRYVVQVRHSLSDEALHTKEGISLLVQNHVCHGGVGRFCKAAYNYCRSKGCEVEPELVPVETDP